MCQTSIYFNKFWYTVYVRYKFPIIYVFHILYTRNSSGDEIANVNFLYDDIVHALQNTIDSNRLMHKFRQRSTRLCVGTYVFTKFSEITQYNGHFVVQSHSRSPISVPIESSYTTSCQWLILTYLLYCTVSKLWLIIRQIFASKRECLTLSLSVGVIRSQYRH